MTEKYRKILEIYEKVELAMICGPFIFGWLPGIIRYRSNSLRFGLAFQNLVIFLFYLVLILLAYLGQKLFLYPMETLYQVQSGLSTLFIATNLAFMIMAFLKKENLVARPVQSLLDKASQMMEQSTAP